MAKKGFLRKNGAPLKVVEVHQFQPPTDDPGSATLTYPLPMVAAAMNIEKDDLTLEVEKVAYGAKILSEMAGQNGTVEMIAVLLDTEQP